MRFHASRGAMSVGVSKGGLPPDSLVEDEARGAPRYQAPHRGLSRQVTVFDAAHRGGAVLALHREPGPDARGGGARPQLRRVAAHPSRRERQGRRLQPRDVRPARRRNMPKSSIGSGTTSGMPTASSSTTMASGCSAAPGPASPIARARTCGSPPASHRSAGCVPPASRSASASTARRRTIPSSLIAEARQAMLLARVGFGPDAMTARQALEIATLGGAKVLNRDDIGSAGAGHGGRFRRLRPCAGSALPARCTIRSRRWCSAHRARSRSASSTGASSSGTAGLRPSTCRS